MNTLLLTGLFLNSAEANPTPFTEEETQDIIDKINPKNEIRLGLCGGLSCAAGVQLEYGTPNFTIGLSSLIFTNSVFAQYNALSTNNDRLRAVIGVRGLHLIDIPYALAGGIGGSVYLGTELHSKKITSRLTVGSYVGSYGSSVWRPSFSVELLYNFGLN